jgi:hypothetical protein
MSRKMREPVCGQDFCPGCGDCLACYGDDMCPVDNVHDLSPLYEEEDEVPVPQLSGSSGARAP